MSDSSYKTIIAKKAGCLDELMLEFLALADENRSYNTLFDLFESVYQECYETKAVVNDPCYDSSAQSKNDTVTSSQLGFEVNEVE